MNLTLPDLCLFKSHLEEAPFTEGVARNAWGLASEAELERWPHCRIWIGSQTRFIETGQVGLRFTVNDYPATAPTAQPWDFERDEALPIDKWPKGPGNVGKVFNPRWNAAALYAPCDRTAMPKHESWIPQFPEVWWTADRTITDYLRFVHRCLNPVGDGT